MNPATFARARALLERVLDLPAAHRRPQLEHLGAEDPAALQEALALLKLEANDPERLEPERLELGLTATLDEPEKELEPGTRLGAWSIENLLGAGGMGAVYAVRRLDGGFAQRAALKVIQSARLHPHLEQRFNQERALLAQLEHPGIARLIDGGSGPDGRPFLVMERIEGDQIHSHCDRRRLTLEARIELCLQLLEALEYAHQRLIVHRDIKPANVIVDREGRARLLDFGVAAVLREEPDPESASGQSGHYLTPSYASPEQRAGLPATTASDVYSLGVLLQLLLVGQLPQAAARGALPVRASEVARRADPAVAAARRTSPRGLARKLRGDLDAILAKALAEDPAQRYPGAAALRKDLQAFLQRRPVEARHGGWTYTATCLIRRHPLAASALAVGLLGLSIGFVKSRAGERTARLALLAETQAHGLAEARLQALAGLSFALLGDLHDTLARLPGSTPVRRLLVDTALERLTALEQEAEANPALEAALARAWTRLAEVQGHRAEGASGEFIAARASIERALHWAQKRLEAAPQAPAGRYELSNILRIAGDLDRHAARLEAAEAEYSEALELASLARSSEPENGSHRRQVRVLEQALGRVQLERGDPAGALETFERGLRELADETGDEPTDAEGLQRLRDRCVLLRVVGLAQRALGRLDQARETFEAGQQAAEQLLAGFPGDPQVTVTGLELCADRVDLELLIGRVDTARALAESSLSKAREIQTLEATNQVFEVAFERLLVLSGDAARAGGDLALARARYDEALDPSTRAPLGENADQERLRERARGHAQRAVLHLMSGEFEAAQGDFDAALELLPAGNSQASDDTQLRAMVLANRGELELVRGDDAAAEATFRQGSELLASWAQGPAPLDWPLRYGGLMAYGLGRLFEARAQATHAPDQAAALLQQAIEQFQAGRDAGLSMRAAGLLLPSETDVPELFEEDIQRCKQARIELEGH